MSWEIILIVALVGIAFVGIGVHLDQRANQLRIEDKTIGWCKRCRKYRPPSYTDRQAGFLKGECSAARFGNYPYTKPDSGEECPDYEYDKEEDEDLDA